MEFSDKREDRGVDLHGIDQLGSVPKRGGDVVTRPRSHHENALRILPQAERKVVMPGGQTGPEDIRSRGSRKVEYPLVVHVVDVQGERHFRGRPADDLIRGVEDLLLDWHSKTAAEAQEIR